MSLFPHYVIVSPDQQAHTYYSYHCFPRSTSPHILLMSLFPQINKPTHITHVIVSPDQQAHTYYSCHYFLTMSLFPQINKPTHITMSLFPQINKPTHITHVIISSLCHCFPRSTSPHILLMSLFPQINKPTQLLMSLFPHYVIVSTDQQTHTYYSCHYFLTMSLFPQINKPTHITHVIISLLCHCFPRSTSPHILLMSLFPYYIIVSPDQQAHTYYSCHYFLTMSLFPQINKPTHITHVIISLLCHCFPRSTSPHILLMSLFPHYVIVSLDQQAHTYYSCHYFLTMSLFPQINKPTHITHVIISLLCHCFPRSTSPHILLMSLFPHYVIVSPDQQAHTYYSCHYLLTMSLFPQINKPTHITHVIISSLCHCFPRSTSPHILLMSLFPHYVIVSPDQQAHTYYSCHYFLTMSLFPQINKPTHITHVIISLLCHCFPRSTSPHILLMSLFPYYVIVSPDQQATHITHVIISLLCHCFPRSTSPYILLMSLFPYYVIVSPDQQAHTYYSCHYFLTMSLFPQINKPTHITHVIISLLCHCFPRSTSPHILLMSLFPYYVIVSPDQQTHTYYSCHYFLTMSLFSQINKPTHITHVIISALCHCFPRSTSPHILLMSLFPHYVIVSPDQQAHTYYSCHYFLTMSLFPQINKPTHITHDIIFLLCHYFPRSTSPHILLMSIFPHYVIVSPDQQAHTYYS